MASYIRREQEWAFQANTAAREIVQLDKQITSADIQIQVADEGARQPPAPDRAGRASRAVPEGQVHRAGAVPVDARAPARRLQAELQAGVRAGEEVREGAPQSSWATRPRASSTTATGTTRRRASWPGEELQLALRRMESAYLNDNRRELELTKSISLLRLDPLALLALRETGTLHGLDPGGAVRPRLPGPLLPPDQGGPAVDPVHRGAVHDGQLHAAAAGQQRARQHVDEQLAASTSMRTTRASGSTTTASARTTRR